MTAVAGTDRAYWRDGVGVFCPISPMASQAGMEAMDGNLDAAKRQLREAGYAQPVPVAPTLEAEVMANKLQHLISEVSSLAVRFERIQQQSTSKVLG